MFRNYLKIGFRNLSKQKFFSVINILGLAVGMCACILIFLFVHFEFNYDRFHSKAERIYRAWLESTTEGEHHVSTHTPLPLGPALRANLAGIDGACRIYKFNSVVKFNTASFNESVHIVDPAIFQVFDFKGIEGDLENALAKPNSIVISNTIAKKYFGDAEAMGKNLEVLLGDEKVLFVVTGVMKDAPMESSIRANIMIPFSNDHYLWNEAMRTSRWLNVWVETYVLLKKGEIRSSIEDRMPAFLKDALANDYSADSYRIHFQPLSRIHMDSSLPEGLEPIANPKYFYILSTIGSLILLLASINFITLSVGGSSKRAIEIGVRRVLGAERKQLMWQFWGESFIITFISFFVGLLLAVLLLHPFNQLIERNLELTFNLPFTGFCFLLVLITGAIAGIYPALVLSGFQPVEVLKGRIRPGVSVGFFRKSLIVCQFAASIALIAGTITVRRQLNYLQHTDMGFYNKEHIIIVPTNLNNPDGVKLGELYKSELLKLPGVINVTVSIFSFAETPWASIGYMDDGKVNRYFQFNAADPDFLKTMGIQLVAGKNFSKQDRSGYSSSILVNETLVKEYGLKDPIGKKLPGKLNQQIIGIMKDFHTESLHKKIRPLVVAAQPDSILHKADQEMFSFDPQPRISVRIFPGGLSKQISDLKKTWQSVAPGRAFEYHFLDESLERQYSQDYKIAHAVNIASGLSILIASMGLFGLTMLTVIKRTKEIGIRKVLGAGVPGIVKVLSGDLLKLVVIASVIAFPVSWFAMNKWLQDFAYRVSISWWVFVLAGSIAVLIMLITVSSQVIKAALMNPVKSLRAE
jgi:putative ABC transport system permease protein